MSRSHIMVQQSLVKTGQTKSSRLIRNSLSLAVGLLIGSIAIAQSSEGSIFGQAKADVPVTITNLDGGASRTIKSDAAGNCTAVDVNSKFETAPGQKNIQLLQSFIPTIKAL